jgi:hypothetical protein
MHDLVIRLDEEHARKLLAAAPSDLTHAMRPDQRELFDKLRAALDSPPVEETEYQVVADADKGDAFFTFRSAREIKRGTRFGAGLPLAKLYLAEAVANYPPGRDPRIESRTVTTLSDGSTLTGPWTDLKEDDDAC